MNRIQVGNILAFYRRKFNQLGKVDWFMKIKVFLKRFKEIPFTEVSERAVLKRLKGKSKFTYVLVDIFDDDLWSSKVSFLGNFIILLMIFLSSLEVVLISENITNTIFKNILSTIYWLTSIVFTIELILRLYVAGFYNEKFQGFKGKIRYLFTFYGFIDLLSILPFYADLLGFSQYHFLKILRMLRIWRVVRYVKAIANLSNALKSKGEEILVSLLGVLLLSITISTLIYYAEEKAGSEQFKSVLNVLVWSLAKYTGDYAGLAEYKPVTLIGQFLATFNGLLGIAIFAVPAGLLGSAFIDELSEQKNKKILQGKIDLIFEHFESLHRPKASLNKRVAYPRHLTFDAITARSLLSENEILSCISAANELTIRAMKSSEEVKFSDIKIIEYSPIFNRTYGAFIENPKSNIWIINSIGATERGVTHFNYTIAENLGYNYVARLKRIFTEDGELFPANYSKKFYEGYEKLSANEAPIEHFDFFEDLKEGIKKEDWVFVIVSGGSGRETMVVEYGKTKGNTEHNFENSTIHNPDKFLEWESVLKQYLSEGITITKKNKTTETFTFSYGLHSVGNYDQAWIGRTIHRLTGANVVTIYINISILTGEDDPYNALLNIFLDTFEKTFGNFGNYKELKLNIK